MIYKNPNSKRVNTFDCVYRKVNKSTKIPRFPYYVDIEPTNYCNLHCKMCPRNIAVREKGFMPKELFEKIIMECNKFRTPIRFIGFGEPLLHPEFKDFVRFVKQKHSVRLKLHVTTNGILLNKEICKTLVNWKVDSVIVSFQGLTEHEYQNMRGCTWEKVEQNLKHLKRERSKTAKPYVHITTTIDKINEKDKKEFLNRWLSLVDSVSIGKTNWAIVNKKLPKNPKYVQCNEVNRLVQVSWDGKVSPCCGDPDNLLTIGNANQESIYNIWNKSEQLKRIRELLKNKGNKTLNLCSRCFPTYQEFD